MTKIVANKAVRDSVQVVKASDGRTWVAVEMSHCLLQISFEEGEEVAAKVFANKVQNALEEAVCMIAGLMFDR